MLVNAVDGGAVPFVAAVAILKIDQPRQKMTSAVIDKLSRL
jgi:hypothetical protein